ncbi:hypothetical protein ABVT39_024000 [Epinephelus coioides]
MAIYKNGLTICALLVTLTILETGNFNDSSSQVLPVHNEEEPFLPHTREKRNVPTGQWNYIIDVVVNASNVETFEQIRSSLNATSLPNQLDNNTKVSDISITTVCSSTGTGSLCRCEEHFAWPYSTCVTYGACDHLSSGICKCINVIPADGQFCQPISALLAQVEYAVDVELNVADFETVDYLRSFLDNGNVPLTLAPTVNVIQVDITTVCYLNGTNSQCRCEEQYVWSHGDCNTYGACDEVIDETCGCINNIPTNGRFCKPKTAPPVVYEYILSVELNISDVTLINQLRIILKNINYPININNQIQSNNVNISTVCSLSSGGYQCRCEDQYLWSCDQCFTYGSCNNITDDTCGCISAIPPDGIYCQPADWNNFTACPLTTVSPSPTPTTPPIVYEYIFSIELNISDITVVNQLRNILRNINYPISITNRIQINDVNISTVCSLGSGGYQCRCEDQYRWSCDQCFLYRSCDNITDDTCACISVIPPDGQYCKPADQHRFTSCPVTTPPPSPTPQVVYEYLISIELNTTDVTVIDRLRTFSYPISINDDVQVSDINITTFCTLSSGGYQCSCEDQYRWSCDQCFLYGSCDNITDDTCGCISAIPPDGQYCQPANQHNFTACTLTTTPSPTASAAPPVVYEYIISVELNISDVTLINQLRTILRNISYPVSINNQIQITSIDLSTVCSLSSGSYHCRCEDQYRWSCDKCSMYGSCDNITDDTCGCISTIPPDGQYCQPADQHNFTVCSETTPAPSRTSPLALYEYIISVELNISDVTLLNQLRTILRHISYPVSINNQIQIHDVNITTVCYPNGKTFQCKCEEQYRWPCQICSTFGNCDDIIDNTCECINAIPPYGLYCQTVSDLFICPSPNPPNGTTTVAPTQNTTILTPTPTVITDTTLIYTTNLNTTPVTVVTSSTTVSTTAVNTTAVTTTTTTTAVTSPTTVATTAVNTTAVTTPTITTNFTTVSTTAVNTIAVTMTPTSITNSSTAGATTVNTTAITTKPTIITNSTAVATTVVNTTTVTMTPTIITNSTTADAATVNSTAITTTPTIITNSTAVATTIINTTVTTTPTILTNSTTADTTTVNTTAITTTPTIITNSTALATTVVNTTTVTTTPTTITNSTTVATTAVNTTTVTTTPTIITNSTQIAPTHPNTTTTTTVSPTTAVTNSTPVATTDVNTTTTDTPITLITYSTTIATTVATTPMPTSTTAATPVTTATSTPAPTTALTTARSTKATTTTIMASTKATTRVTTTISPTTTPTTATGSSAPSTTRASTSTPAITTMPPTTAVTGFDVEMSVELDKEYTAELNDATSATYKDLERRINAVLEKQYEGLTGFIDVSVSRFREGSIITDFVVETTEVIADEVAEANGKLREAMQPIATVIGPVTASYNSTTTISFPSLTYTGNTMLLTCGPPENVNVGLISGSVWKFQGREIKESGRLEVTTSRMESVLTVKNVILADIGHYECTLTGGVINFHQNGDITRNEIRPAPIVRLQSRVNVKCDGTEEQKPLQCCVQYPYKVRWFLDSPDLPLDVTVTTNNGETYCITHDYQLQSCSESQLQFTCKVNDPEGYEKTTNMIIFREEFTCKDPPYGTGRVKDISTIGCDSGQEGSRTAVCQETGEWNILEDTCIITQIKELLIDSEDLVVEEVPVFVMNLSATVRKEKTEVANSSATISAIVDIIQNIATVSTEEVTRPVIENILETVDVIIGDDSRESWAVLNANQTRNASSELLASLESLSNGLIGEFDFATERILLNRTTFNNSFRADLNNSILIDIPDTNLFNVSITTITFSTLYNVMPPRNSSFEVSLFNTTSNDTVTANAINAAVVLVQINETIRNVTLSYDKLNSSLSLYPQCVFWNFTLFDKLGAWDDKGCTFVSDINNTVTCSCNHLTSFSILMATDIPQDLILALDIITYVGVGISLASLVVCLIIEGYVWKAITRNSTAFMRHVSIINTALSLLIADICFIIAASIAMNPLENPREDYTVSVGPCSTATFFMHFFFLALFFWMLVSGLLLFYRTVMVFSHMSKSTMLAIGFTLGYGCPLMIAVITVAVTAPNNEYIRRDQACWLNWFESMALLAMVIPALTIVFINILIVIVVLFKMLRRGVGDAAQTDEKHTMVVIIRCVVILTPLFGLTWSLGVGTMISPTDRGIHIAFAFFNSLQGFFILVFGTLFDSKIRSILSRKLPASSTGSRSNPTRSTSTGISSVSGLSWISRLRGRRYIYRVSEAANSSSTGASESFINI